MKRIALVPVLVLFAAPVWAQDDVLEFHDRDPERGRITKMTYQEITLEKVFGDQVIPQPFESPKIKSITFHINNKGYEVNRGESKLRSGDYKEAIKILKAVPKSPNVTNPAKQLGYKFLIMAYIYDGNDDGAEQAIQSFRKKFPDTYFLLWTYQTQYEVAARKGDKRAMKKIIDEFEKKADQLNDSFWKKSAQIMRAEFHEAMKEWRQALPIHKRLERDSNVGSMAKRGILRCLSALKDPSLQAKAKGIIRSEKDKPRPDFRLLMAAYNGQGDARFHKGATKDALLDYMRVVVVYGPQSGETSPEHEAGIAKAAIAAAKYASEQKDEAKKEDYKARAEGLLKELRITYGTGSWFRAAKKAVESVK